MLGGGNGGGGGGGSCPAFDFFPKVGNSNCHLESSHFILDYQYLIYKKAKKYAFKVHIHSSANYIALK